MTGQNYEEYWQTELGKPAEAPEFATPTMEYEDTTAGQMEKLLSSDSPYLEAARTRGKQFAGQRGLLSSSMAAGATEAEAIKAALPIAQQDAGYMQSRGLEAQRGGIQAGLYETQGRISGGLLAQEGAQARELSALGGEIQTGLTELEAKQKAGLSAQEATQEIALENIQQEGANYRFNIENDLKVQMAEMELSSNERSGFAAAMSSMGRQFEESIANVQRDPNVTAENKTAAIITLQDAYQANLETLAGIYDLPLSWAPLIAEEEAEAAERAAAERAAAEEKPSRKIRNPAYEYGPDYGYA